MEACERISHIFFVLALFAWNLDLDFLENLVSGSNLPLCVATVDGCSWTNFVFFLREKWTRISLQFTLGNLELFLRAVSGSLRVRQSTVLLEEFHIFSTCWLSLFPAQFALENLDIISTCSHMAVGGVLGGSDAFFALLRIVPELSASFGSPRWRRVLCHRGLPLPIRLLWRGHTRIHSGFRTTATTTATTGVLVHRSFVPLFFSFGETTADRTPAGGHVNG